MFFRIMATVTEGLVGRLAAAAKPAFLFVLIFLAFVPFVGRTFCVCNDYPLNEGNFLKLGKGHFYLL